MKLRLVDELQGDWRRCWRWGSVRLATAVGSLIGFAFANWGFTAWLIGALMPQTLLGQIVTGVLIAALSALVPILTRIFTKGAADG